MPRHGRILTTIWEDSDFKRLDSPEQRLYLFLLSQANVNHAGVLPITLKRWASKAADLAVVSIEDQLARLEAARFVVVDDESEELLIRTFIRNDGVWRQPNVMASAVNSAGDISSVKIRRALLAEIDRLEPEALSDAPSPKGGPSVRAQIWTHIQQMRTVLDVPPDPDPPHETGCSTPPEGFGKGSTGPESPAEPTENPSGNPSEGVPTRAHARAPSPPPSPAPTRTPERGRASATAAAPSQPDGRHPLPEDFTLTDAMRRTAAATFPTLNADHETAQFISHYRADGGRRANWPEEWMKWMRRGAKYQSERALQQTGPVQGAFLTALPGGRPLTGTDANVQAWLDLRESS